MSARGLTSLAWAFVSLGAGCAAEPDCPAASDPGSDPGRSLSFEFASRRLELGGPAGWTTTASISGPFAWTPEELSLSWPGDGYAEGTVTLTHRDPAGECPVRVERVHVRASVFERSRLVWREAEGPTEVPAGIAVGVDLVVRNEGHIGAWLPSPEWRGGGAQVTSEGAVWVPALSDATQRLTLVADGGSFAGTLDWGEHQLHWRGEGMDRRLIASESLDFGELVIGDVARRGIGLRALNLPIELVHIEGPNDGPFEWGEVDVVEGQDVLPVRFAPTEPGRYSAQLQIWWQARERIEVHQALLEGRAVSCEQKCMLPGATASCGGGCRIDRCLSGFVDANDRDADGCECADHDDPSGECARARSLAELRDNGQSLSATGVLAGPGDADVWRLIAADGSNLFSESFDVRIELEGPEGLELCVRSGPGRWPLGSCAPAGLECGPRHRIEGRFLQDDTQTLWLHLRNPTKTCADYRIVVSNG